MLKEILPWLCVSIIPYSLALIFNNCYVAQFVLKQEKDPSFSENKLKRFDLWRHILLFLGFPLALIMSPILNHSYKALYARYKRDISRAYRIGCDNHLSPNEKEKQLDDHNINLGGSLHPIDLPPDWYTF